MAEINDLNISDSLNTARFPEGQAPSTVNDGMRAVEGILARWHKDINGSLVATGTANAYVVAANRTLGALYDGLSITFEANFTNTGSATLNVDSLGAKTINKNHNVALGSGDIESGQKVQVIYDSDGDIWQMVSSTAIPSASLGANTFTENQTIQSDDSGSTVNPRLTVYRNSASPAADDQLGAIYYEGQNSLGALTIYANHRARIVDPTSGSEDGEWVVRTIGNSGFNDRLAIRLGVILGAATGGDQGAGTINTEGTFLDGVEYTRGWTEMTAQASTSGTAIDFSSIPDGIQEVIIDFDGVSLSGTDDILVQIGTGATPQTSGYISVSSVEAQNQSDTTGFHVLGQNASETNTGPMRLTRVRASTNAWVMDHSFARPVVLNTAGIGGGGRVELGANNDLNIIRITRDGTNTFDAGEIGVSYR